MHNMSEKDDNKIRLFEDQVIRTAWDEERQEWYFSIVDVVAVLTEQKNARGASNYWAKLKQRLKEEGAVQLLTNCQQLKMTATDGKKRLTDVANTEQLLRIIQSIPSPKAEPFKAWLAMVGREHIEETIDPEQAIDRAWSGMTTKQYKRLKGLKKENLRDNMTDLELVLTMLAEASTKDISKSAKPKGLEENQEVARRGGRVAGVARQALEAETGQTVITSQNANDFRKLIADIVEDAASLPENE